MNVPCAAAAAAATTDLLWLGGETACTVDRQTSSSPSHDPGAAQYPCLHRDRMSAEVRTRVPTSVLEYNLIQKRRKLGEEKVVGWGLIVTVLVFTLAATAAELVLAQITHCISLLVLSYQVQ